MTVALAAVGRAVLNTLYRCERGAARRGNDTFEFADLLHRSQHTFEAHSEVIKEALSALLSPSLEYSGVGERVRRRGRSGHLPTRDAASTNAGWCPYHDFFPTNTPPPNSVTEPPTFSQPALAQ